MQFRSLEQCCLKHTSEQRAKTGGISFARFACAFFGRRSSRSLGEVPEVVKQQESLGMFGPRSWLSWQIPRRHRPHRQTGGESQALRRFLNPLPCRRGPCGIRPVGLSDARPPKPGVCGKKPGHSLEAQANCNVEVITACANCLTQSFADMTQEQQPAGRQVNDCSMVRTPHN